MLIGNWSKCFENMRLSKSVSQQNYHFELFITEGLSSNYVNGPGTGWS